MSYRDETYQNIQNCLKFHLKALMYIFMASVIKLCGKSHISHYTYWIFPDGRQLFKVKLILCTDSTGPILCTNTLREDKSHFIQIGSLGTYNCFHECF